MFWLFTRQHHGFYIDRNAYIFANPNSASASAYNSYDIKLNAALLIMARIVPARP